MSSLIRRLLNEHDGDDIIEDGETFDEDYDFIHLYHFLIFLVALYGAGKICEKIYLPPVVGEIIMGMVCGPHLLNIAPHSESLKMLGECGLVLLVIEAGIEVDLPVLKLIGMQGVGVAVLGCVLTVAMGYGLATGLGYDSITSLAMGACFAPTSVGIAIAVLKRGEVLNTNIGQLVIAAAVLDDILSLVILGVIQSLDSPTAWHLLKPLVVSLGFLVGFGYVAVVLIPKMLPKLYDRIDPDQKKWYVLGFVFVMAMALIPATHYAGTSYLLGAFLAGLCLCTDHEAHKYWNIQCSRAMTWLLRLFFACTIGFEVPIGDVWEAGILFHTGLFTLCIAGKLITGIFAPSGEWLDGLKIGFAMSAWGEFAFIIATTSKSEGILDKNQFSTVTMAVLLSVIISPLFLTYVINLDNQRKAEAAKKGFGANAQLLNDDGKDGGGFDPFSSIASIPGAMSLPVTGAFKYERRHSWWIKAEEDTPEDKKKFEHKTMLLPSRAACMICGRATSYACFACSMEKHEGGLPTLCHPAKKGKTCWKQYHDMKNGRIFSHDHHVDGMQSLSHNLQMMQTPTRNNLMTSLPTGGQLQKAFPAPNMSPGLQAINLKAPSKKIDSEKPTSPVTLQLPTTRPPFAKSVSTPQ